MTANSLADTASALVAPGKGILAADESNRTIGGRFAALDVESTERSRRDYREMLFRTSGVEAYISGVILYDETLRQKASDGQPIVDLLTGRGIMPGIKVDTGANPLAAAPGEMVTEGLDGLRDRLAEYAEIGARFTKWRAVINIGDNGGDILPSDYCIAANSHALARYAALAQEAGLVPIVEPEAMMDGAHSIETCAAVTELTLRRMYDDLLIHRVDLAGTLLKANMVVSGKDADDRAEPREVAERTLDVLMRTVPASVPGVVFLSGGQGDEEATANLNAIVLRGREVGAPWELSFSFARGLQSAAMQKWAGDAANAEDAQAIFHTRATLTAAARRGEYGGG